MGRVEGKVALITGAARGQGRSHALRLAEEGADIIAIDLCEQIGSVPYPMATPDDLAETAKLVEEQDRRIVTAQADVRERRALEAVVAEGLSQFGHIDIVCANAGILSMTGNTLEISTEQWQDMLDVNLTGVWKTCRAVIPAMIEAGRGGSLILTSSTAGIKGFAGGAGHYIAAKHGVVGLMRTLANELAPHSIRVNTVHPTGVNTDMVANDFFTDFVEHHPEITGAMQNLLPVELLEPRDISNAVLWLASDEARYVTGVTLPVDAGITQK